MQQKDDVSKMRPYLELVVDYCKLTGITELAEVAAVASGQRFSIDGTDFRMVCIEEINPDQLFVFCSFGEVPPELAVKVYRQLLEVNLPSYDGYSQNFALCPDSNTILCIARFQVPQASAQQLYSSIIKLSQEAQEWRGKLCFRQHDTTVEQYAAPVEPTFCIRQHSIH